MIDLKEKNIRFGKRDVKLSPKGKRLVLQNIKPVEGQPLEKAKTVEGSLTLHFDSVESLDTLISTLNDMRGYF